jgi:hypothetical protein
MTRRIFRISALAALLFATHHGSGQIQTLDSTRRHLRNRDPREWSEFPLQPSQKTMEIHFASKANRSEQTLFLRQYDVKLNWQVVLNDQLLGTLFTDEKDLMQYFKMPPGILKAENLLEIKCADGQPDDILVGSVMLDPRAENLVLSEGIVDLEVNDGDTRKPIPSRITIVNDMATLQTVAAFAGDPLAVRPGFVYTGNGKASLGLPSGTYTLYAGRGFEYGIDSVKLTVKPGDHIFKNFYIKREVATNGWISSDTHIHTFTYSRHGDATVAERVLTIAGEGVELPISTDHNVFVDLKPFAVDNGVDKYFTSVIGNELTTQVGHFNLFPARTAEMVPDPAADSWDVLAKNIDDTSGVIILNHARDIHLGFRPFDPEIHLSSAGMRLDGWQFPANAMEVINSGSQQTDPMELSRDWFGMLNAGHFITPVGSSDSHDVSRFIVGQARTYIRVQDEDPGHIDVDTAIRNFRKGKVMVSLGLLTELTVNDIYSPGDLVPGGGEINVAVKVSGPAWTRAERISLYANGKKIHEERIVNGSVAGLKWSGSWKIAVPRHDIFLVAIADGPGGGMPFWPIAKPFQPTSPDWQPRLIGLTGAVWIDGDKNGAATSARSYAQRLIEDAGGNLKTTIKLLGSYDEAVAVQVAALLHRSGLDLTSANLSKDLRQATPEIRSGFRRVSEELKLTRK